MAKRRELGGGVIFVEITKGAIIQGKVVNIALKNVLWGERV